MDDADFEVIILVKQYHRTCENSIKATIGFEAPESRVPIGYMQNPQPVGRLRAERTDRVGQVRDLVSPAYAASPMGYTGDCQLASDAIALKALADHYRVATLLSGAERAKAS